VHLPPAAYGSSSIIESVEELGRNWVDVPSLAANFDLALASSSSIGELTGPGTRPELAATSFAA
jgi:hypothetical protein